MDRRKVHGLGMIGRRRRKAVWSEGGREGGGETVLHVIFGMIRYFDKNCRRTSSGGALVVIKCCGEQLVPCGLID